MTRKGGERSVCPSFVPRVPAGLLSIPCAPGWSVAVGSALKQTHVYKKRVWKFMCKCLAIAFLYFYYIMSAKTRRGRPSCAALQRFVWEDGHPLPFFCCWGGCCPARERRCVACLRGHCEGVVVHSCFVCLARPRLDRGLPGARARYRSPLHR